MKPSRFVLLVTSTLLVLVLLGGGLAVRLGAEENPFSQPVLFAREFDRLTVEVNPEPTVLSGIVDYALRGPSGRYLPLIENVLKGRITQ